MLVCDGHEVRQESVREALQNETVFVDLYHPDPTEVRHVVGDVFECHPLVVEDCLRLGTGAQIDRYADHVYFPFFFLKEDWTLMEVSVVMGHNFVIVVVPEPMPFLNDLHHQFKENPVIMQSPGRILYEFLDSCVHHYLDFIDSLEDKIDEMENQVYDSPETSIAPEIFSQKRQLHHIRRTMSGERTVMESLMHSTFPYTTEADNAYFMDLFDHINRIVDALDSFRDGLGGLLDLQMALKSDRMNSIMKTLTIVSTFFMPLSFIAGWYGMNVAVPAYHWRFGYPLVWALSILSVAGFWWYFKKKKWF